MFLSRLLILFCLSSVPAFAHTSSWVEGKSKASEVRLQSQLSEVSSETFEILLGLEFRLSPGWHVYWKNPGDVGYAPKLKWTLPKEWSATDLFYPAPKILAAEGQSELVSFGYENKVTYPLYLQGSSAISNEFVADLDLEYLVCKEQCIPEKAQLKLRLPLGKEILSPVSNALSKALEEIPTETKKYEVEWLNEKEFKLKLSENDVEISLLALHSRGLKGKFWSEENLGPNQFLVELEKRPSSDIEFVALASNKSFQGSFETQTRRLDSSIFLTLLIAFIGGLILNLMPCILPVVIMKTSHLFELRSKGQSFRQSLVFTILGILVSFIAIGMITSLLRAGGEQIGWGFQFQNAGFLLFLILALYVFVLNLFEVFEFNLPLAWSTRIGSQSGSFVEGVFATLLATPCSAPFLGTALTYALTQGPLASVSVFLAMGIGLATPYTLFLARPSLINLLPRPGNWMLKMKRFLAYSIIFVIFWLIYLFFQQTNIFSFMGLLVGLLFLMICLREIKSPWKWAFAGIVVLSLAFALIKENAYETAGIEAYKVEDFIEEAKNDEARFLYITADWCFTCKFNEASVINTKEFQEFARDEGFTIRKVDWTQRDESVSGFLDKFGRVGIPFALISKSGKYFLFPELMTMGSTKEEILKFLTSPEDHAELPL